MLTDFDLIIVGGGLVGASLAAALEPAGLSIALIEADVPRPVPADDSIDARVFAISPGSAAFLESSGIWQGVPEERLARIETMRVHGDRPGSLLEFSAYESGLRELAFIAESRVLQRAIQERLQSAPHVRLYCPARCAAVRWGSDTVQVTLEDGEELGARLLVGADGVDSWVRSEAEIAAYPRAYDQLGVVANFRTEHPHHGTAYQWFRRDGVLALLPLPGTRSSMVWSTGEDHGRELLGAAPAELAAMVATASGQALGDLEPLGPPAAFPLRLQRVARLVKPRVALIGDAAHNVHPLAGQGVNLGFRDARELAAVLASRGPVTDLGDYGLLRRYERARKEDILAMQLATDGLQRLFAADAAWVAGMRNFGLNMVDGLRPIKMELVRRAVA